MVLDGKSEELGLLLMALTDPSIRLGVPFGLSGRAVALGTPRAGTGCSA